MSEDDGSKCSSSLDTLDNDLNTIVPEEKHQNDDIYAQRNEDSNGNPPKNTSDLNVTADPSPYMHINNAQPLLDHEIGGSVQSTSAVDVDRKPEISQPQTPRREYDPREIVSDDRGQDSENSKSQLNKVKGKMSVLRSIFAKKDKIRNTSTSSLNSKTGDSHFLKNMSRNNSKDNIAFEIGQAEHPRKKDATPNSRSVYSTPIRSITEYFNKSFDKLSTSTSDNEIPSKVDNFEKITSAPSFHPVHTSEGFEPLFNPSSASVLTEKISSHSISSSLSLENNEGSTQFFSKEKMKRKRSSASINKVISDCGNKSVESIPPSPLPKMTQSKSTKRLDSMIKLSNFHKTTSNKPVSFVGLIFISIHFFSCRRALSNIKMSAEENDGVHTSVEAPPLPLFRSSSNSIRSGNELDIIVNLGPAEIIEYDKDGSTVLVKTLVG